MNTDVEIGAKEVMRVLRESITEAATIQAFYNQQYRGLRTGQLLQAISLAHFVIGEFRDGDTDPPSLRNVKSAMKHARDDLEEGVSPQSVIEGLRVVAGYLDHCAAAGEPVNISPDAWAALVAMRDDLARMAVEVGPLDED